MGSKEANKSRKKERLFLKEKNRCGKARQKEQWGCFRYFRDYDNER